LSDADRQWWHFPERQADPRRCEGADAAPCLRLLNAAELMPDNASRNCLELERE
jgi:hypothetical protein